MNPRITVWSNGHTVIGRVDDVMMLTARVWYNKQNAPRYKIHNSWDIPKSLDLAELYAECVKEVVRKCRELQNIQE